MKLNKNCMFDWKIWIIKICKHESVGIVVAVNFAILSLTENQPMYTKHTSLNRIYWLQYCKWWNFWMWYFSPAAKHHLARFEPNNLALSSWVLYCCSTAAGQRVMKLNKNCIFIEKFFFCWKPFFFQISWAFNIDSIHFLFQLFLFRIGTREWYGGNVIKLFLLRQSRKS